MCAPVTEQPCSSSLPAVADCLAISQQFKSQLAELIATQQRLEIALAGLQQSASNAKTTTDDLHNKDARASLCDDFDVKKYVADYLMAHRK